MGGWRSGRDAAGCAALTAVSPHLAPEPSWRACATCPSRSRECGLHRKKRYAPRLAGLRAWRVAAVCARCRWRFSRVLTDAPPTAAARRQGRVRRGHAAGRLRHYHHRPPDRRAAGGARARRRERERRGGHLPAKMTRAPLSCHSERDWCIVLYCTAALWARIN